MKLSSKSRYALEALLAMAVYHGTGVASIRQIAAETGVTEAYLEQIFFRLRKNGVLKAIRGAGGGFQLASPLEAITVGHILHAMEAPLVPVNCVNDLSQCKSKIRGRCVTRGLWIQASYELEQVIGEITLDVLRQQFLSQEAQP